MIHARNWYFEHTVGKMCTPEMLDKILRNDYIPKQKVENKIKELEQEIKDYLETDNTGRFRRDNCRLTDEVNILKEILQESEGNK